jgi:hypothetical protein
MPRRVSAGAANRLGHQLRPDQLGHLAAREPADRTRAPADWMLELAYPPLDRLELYSPDGKGGFAGRWAVTFAFCRSSRGAPQPRDAGAPEARRHQCPLPAGDIRAARCRRRSLWQPAALWRHDQAEYATISLYFGLLIGCCSTTCCCFLGARPAYLIYVAVRGCMAIAQAALTGLGRSSLARTSLVEQRFAAGGHGRDRGLRPAVRAQLFLSSALRMPRLDRLMLALVARLAADAAGGAHACPMWCRPGW